MTVGAAFPREPMARNALVSATDTTLQQCQWNLFCPPPAPSFLIHLLCLRKHLHKKKHAQTKKGACVYVSVCVCVSVGTLLQYSFQHIAALQNTSKASQYIKCQNTQQLSAVQDKAVSHWILNSLVETLHKHA